MQRSPSFVIIDQDTSSSESGDLVDSIIQTSESDHRSSKESSLSPVEVIGANEEISTPVLEITLDADHGPQECAGIKSVVDRASPEPETNSQTAETQTVAEESAVEVASSILESSVSQSEISENIAPPAGILGDVVWRGIEIIHKIHGISEHIDNTSKLIALSILICGVLLPTTTVYMNSRKETPHPDVSPRADERMGVAVELEKCKQTLQWRQEKISQYQSKFDKTTSKLKSSEASLADCRWALSDCQTTTKRQEAIVQGLKEKVKRLEEMYEKSQETIIELQDAIIRSDDEEEPFLKRAFNTVFGRLPRRLRKESRRAKRPRG